MGLVTDQNGGPDHDRSAEFACNGGPQPLAMFAADRIRGVIV